MLPDIFIARDLTVLLPQLLLALTVIDPLVIPDVTVMERVVELPDQPVGKVHV